MKKLWLLLLLIVWFSFDLGAQRTDFPTSEKLQLKRTYPIDSCLYFTLPFDFLVRNAQTIGGGGGGSTGVTISFSVTEPSGTIIRGRGRFILTDADFPLGGWDWSSGQRGRIQIILPDNVLGSGNQDQTGESNFVQFPVLTTGFLLAVGENALAPAYQVNFQLTALESNL